MHNIFAYTEASYPYPPYLNVSRINGEVVFTVREKGQSGTQFAEITLPADQITKLVEALQQNAALCSRT